MRFNIVWNKTWSLVFNVTLFYSLINIFKKSLSQKLPVLKHIDV